MHVGAIGTPDNFSVAIPTLPSIVIPIACHSCLPLPLWTLIALCLRLHCLAESIGRAMVTAIESMNEQS